MVKNYIVKTPMQFLSVSSLDCFSEEISHRRRLPVEVNLGGISFVRPQAVIATVMFIETMIARNRSINVIFPGDSGTLNYLVAIGLPEAMNDLNGWNWPNEFPKEATKGLRPMVRLTKFTSPEDVEQIAREIEAVFDDQFAGLGSLLQPCHMVFSELADNSITHSRSHGYVLAQGFEYEAGPVIDITVGDCGIGLRKSLQKNRSLRPKLRNDVQAINLAMTDGVTRFAGDPYRGYGLGQVNRELSARDRRLVLRSGNAIDQWKEGHRVRVTTCGASIGTLAHIVIPC